MKSSANDDLPIPDSPQTIMLKFVVVVFWLSMHRLLLVNESIKSSLESFYALVYALEAYYYYYLAYSSDFDRNISL